jgi:hypothetical protein
MESELKGRGLPASVIGTKSAVRPVFGVGLSFHITKNFSMRLDMDLTSVETSDNQTGSVATFMGGVGLHF